MTKTLKYLLPAMALGMVACSNEIPGDSTLPGSELTGKTAYMKINISSAETTRAVEDGGLKYGDGGEHDVNDAKFIFFDAEGNFVTTASVWTGGTNGTTPNVEFMGNNVIVLKNLNEKPVRYLLTVLNLPNFEPSFTLTETALKLQDHRNVISDKNYHVMSTSTYYATDEDPRHDNAYPYVTVVNPSDYMVQPVEADMAGLDMSTLPTVDIYVERLSAKFQLGVGDNITTAGDPVILENGRKLYPIRATIGGGNNSQIGGSNDNIGADQLYVEFLGWGLNATEQHSFISKQVGADWATNAPFAGWNDPDNHRSYWAMSHLYGEDPSDHLNYYTYNEILSQSTIGGKALYANENTNTAAVLFPGNAQKVVPAQVTHVVVAARLTDKDGKALDMIRATGGEMFTKEAYIANIFNKVNPQLFYRVGEEYIQISPEDAQLDWTRDEAGHVTIKSNGFNKIVYKGTTTEVATEDDLNTLLAKAQSGYYPEVFNGGMMYYTIPIEHLAALAVGDTPAAPNVEAYYGVVRNHWYVLTINNLARIGHGVFDPDKDKIKVEDPEDETYLLGAKINILSWKVLNQSVNL